MNNKTKRRVAIIGTRGYPSYYGGFETAVRHLAPFLVSNGWRATVYGRPGTTNPDDPERNLDVESVVTPGLETASLSTLTHGLTASFHAWWKKPDVALIMNVANGFFLPLLRTRGIRTVVNVDGIEWDRAKWGRCAKLLFKAGAWFTARFADELIFDSEEIGRRWREEFGRDGTFIPYGGIPAEPLPLESNFKHRSYVLVVARFVPENTIPEFFDAVETLAEEAPVIIVGSSGYGGEMEERAAELAKSQNVTWTGHIRDDRRLHSLWQHAGVYFHGHSVGGTNPTLVQAMMLGSPVVARDTPYNREVLAAGGRYCAADAESIITEVSNLLRDPSAQEQASRDNQKRAENSYDWGSVLMAYRGLLEAVCARKK